MRYPVTLTPADEGGFVVTFPDVPEALTQGEDEADALHHAADALETALDFYFEANRLIPEPSQLGRGQPTIVLPTGLAATVLLHNELIRQNVPTAELARRMNVPGQDVSRLLNRRTTTKIDRTSAALKALGKQLEVSIS